MSETRPWFKMYVARFLSSPKVIRMSAEERGLYFTLLLRSWMDDGYVLHTEDLADELSLSPADVTGILSGRVGRCFFTDEEGRMRNERLEAERASARKTGATSAANGRKGGRPKKPPAETQQDRPGSLAPCENPPGSNSNPEEPGGLHPEPGETCPSLLSSPLLSSPGPKSTQTPSPPKPPPRRRRGQRRAGKADADDLQLALDVHLAVTGYAPPAEVRDQAWNWLNYRRQACMKPWTEDTWIKQLERASHDDTGWCAKVERAIRDGSAYLDPPPNKAGSGSLGARAERWASQTPDDTNQEGDE